MICSYSVQSIICTMNDNKSLIFEDYSHILRRCLFSLFLKV